MEPIFYSYWKQVRSQLGLSPRDPPGLIRKEAIDLLTRNWNVLDGEIVHTLYKSLDSKGWAESHGTNWEWRTEHTTPSEKNNSQEVLLEHRIVKEGGECWTRQMSTASGVDVGANGRRARTNRRRSIDLVHDRGDGHFAFIELKVLSDYPIYAIFEILGYGLAYLHARKEKTDSNTNKVRVMQAKAVDLVVLGAEQWYRDKPPGKAVENRAAIEIMIDKLNRGLTSLIESKDVNVQFKLMCSSYPCHTKNAAIAAKDAITAISRLKNHES